MLCNPGECTLVYTLPGSLPCPSSSAALAGMAMVSVFKQQCGARPRTPPPQKLRKCLPYSCRPEPRLRSATRRGHSHFLTCHPTHMPWNVVLGHSREPSLPLCSSGPGSRVCGLLAVLRDVDLGSLGFCPLAVGTGPQPALALPPACPGVRREPPWLAPTPCLCM